MLADPIHPALTELAAAIAGSDLSDWQALAALQAQAQALEIRYPGQLAATVGRVIAIIDSLFGFDVPSQVVAESRTTLLGLLAGAPQIAVSEPDQEVLLPTAATRPGAFRVVLQTLGEILEGRSDSLAGCQEAIDRELATVQPDDVRRVLLLVRAALQMPQLPQASLRQVHAWLDQRRCEADPLAAERATIIIGPLTAAVEPPPEMPAAGADPALGLGEPLPIEANPDTAAEFLTEASEYVETIERLMLLIEAEPTAEHLNGIFRAFHTIKGLSGFLHLRRIQILAHASEDLLDRMRTGTVVIDRQVVDLLLSALDQLKMLLSGLGAGIASGHLPPSPHLPTVITALRIAAGTRTPAQAQILAANHDPQRAARDLVLAIPTHLQPAAGLCEDFADAGQMSPRASSPAQGQQAAPPLAVQAMASSSMRVDIARVDALNDAIGELVIAQNMVSCCPELRALGSRRVQVLLAQLDRVTRSIQDMSMRLRLVSIQPVFQRMVRLGRDAAKGLGKEVEIITEGEDQELDKSVVERLGDPLVHLVRNAIDHGLEQSAVREAAGKPRMGRVTLRAFRRAGGFCVEISDDGRGLDRQRILAKAIECGLIRENQALRDDEIINLIFLPGLTTVEQVTDLSGRGVGMDVVRRMVEEMRGQVQLASEPGHGTTITIALPLTLAIIDGMEISVAEQRYILPTLSVVTTLRPTPQMLTGFRNRGCLLTFGGRQIPVYDLRAMFGQGGMPASRPLVVVVEDGNRQAALMIDGIHGRHQVVVKSMSRGLPPAPGIGGATIGGDGRVCLVCDVAGLIQLANTSMSAFQLASQPELPHEVNSL